MNPDGSAANYSTGNTAPDPISNTDIPDGSTPYVLPRQTGSGTTRGTQLVTGPDGSVIGMGQIPGSTEFGFFATDSTGNVVMSIVGGTMSVFDPANSYVNITQSGLLPDGSGGFVVAKPGINVEAAFGDA